MTAVLRRAVVGDAAALTETAQAAYEVYLERMPPGLRPGPMDVDYAAAIRDAEVWVAEVGSRVGGYLVLVARRDHLLLENIAVRPDLQGRGIGRQLLAHAEERAHHLGLPIVRLYTHVVMVENQALYERTGYVETHRRVDGGFERVFYEKRL